MSRRGCGIHAASTRGGGVRRTAPVAGAIRPPPSGVEGRVLELQERAGNAAVLDLLGEGNGYRPQVQRQPPEERPTFGNLFPEDEPNEVPRYRLQQIDGEWWEIRAEGEGRSRPARGTYSYVVQGDEIIASKRYGHVDLAKGERVSYAGEITFEEKGKLSNWTNRSGHTRPSKWFVMKDRARLERLGLLEAKFKAREFKGARPGPALAVWHGPGTPISDTARRSLRARLKGARVVVNRANVRAGLRTGLRAGAVAGLFAIIDYFAAEYIERRAIEKGMQRVEEESGEQIALTLEDGMALAIDKPAASVHANIVFKMGWMTTPGPEGEDVTSPPLISKGDVHVFFDTEARDGELASGEIKPFGPFAGSMTWTQIGASIPLDELLDLLPDDVRAAFAAEHGAALSGYRAAHPREGRAGYGIAPAEDPVRR